jgi:hypothetical protein
VVSCDESDGGGVSGSGGGGGGGGGDGSSGMAGGVVSCGGSASGASSGGEIPWLSYHPSITCLHTPGYQTKRTNILCKCAGTFVV